MKSGRLKRLLKILMALRSGQHVTVDMLARLFSTSRRTIFRDLKELQEMGICGPYDPNTGSYTLESEAALPAMDLDREEALSLLLTQRAGQQLRVPYRQSGSMAALKVRDKLPHGVRAYCNRILDSVSSRTTPDASSEHLDKIFTQLQEAIVSRRRVRLNYALPSTTKGISLAVNPCRLHYDHPHWYLFARPEAGRPVKIFKLYSIRSVTLLEIHFEDDSRFDPVAALGRAWAMQPEGRLFHVKLRFTPAVADAVLGVEWHSTQQGQRQPDGSALVEFRVDGLREITWWILSYGDQVEVLAPRVLRNRVLKMARNIVKTHESVK